MADEGNTSGRDKGNASYTDRGYIGHRTSSEEKFPKPAGNVFFTGYGADEADLVRGYNEPTIREIPDFDLSNYKERWGEPKNPDDDMDNRTPMGRDWDFRDRERPSRGFLVRDRQFKQRG